METLRLLRSENVIFFLGAGASVGTERERVGGEGLPLGSAMADAIVSEFGINHQGSNLRKTASVAARRTSVAAVKSFVAQEIATRSRSPLEAHRALAQIRPPLVVTTNYDDLYEKALAEIGEHAAKIVREQDLAHIPRSKPQVLKFHGDAGDPASLVVTGEDYLDWEGRVEALFSDVAAGFRRSSCVFIGYGMADENLRQIIGLVRKRLGKHAPKHYALVDRVDEGTAAEFGESVEFVEGDATEFLQALAEKRQRETPGSFDSSAEESRFYEAMRLSDFDEATEVCKRLQEEYLRRGAANTAAAVWRELADAAREADDRAVAAGAYTEAGQLYLKARQETLAEAALEKARENARTANAPAAAVEIETLLQEARLSGGDYHAVLRETTEVLAEQGEHAAPDFLYAIRRKRAAAKETLGDDAGALAELEAALEAVPIDQLYLRTDLRCTAARIHSGLFEWDVARATLEEAETELEQARDTEETETKRSGALIKLVRANVHQALGEDQEATALYEECEKVFSDSGDEALLISAMKESMYCRQFLGEFPTETARARLRDLTSGSTEYRRISDQRQSGITTLAHEKLAEAHGSLLRSISGAKAVYSPSSERAALGWYAQVLLVARNLTGAISGYVLAGDRKKSGEVASMIAKLKPPEPLAWEQFVAGLVETAKDGSVLCRGAALAALKAVADVLPIPLMDEVTELLSTIEGLPGHSAADRNLLTPMAEFAQESMPLLDENQALRVGDALVRVIERDGLWWASYKACCAALAELAHQQPVIVSEINVPVERLVRLIEDDVINDRHEALAALANLALAGHEESDRRAKEIVRTRDDIFHIRWRHLLGDVGEDELASTIQAALPMVINKVQETENGVRFGIGALSPSFLLEFDLPERLESEVATVLIESAVDTKVLVPDRQAAAFVLGQKVDLYNDEECIRAFDALYGLLGDVEIHPVLRSITNPISAMRINIGQPNDIRSAAAESLLSLSTRVDGERRKSLMEAIEQLRAGQSENLGRGVAAGLKQFRPEGRDDLAWLSTRMLLLLNAPHPLVRRSAALSLGDLVEQGIMHFDNELLDILLFLSTSVLVTDRTGAAYALTRAWQNAGWAREEVWAAVEKLLVDSSRTVRHVSHL